MKNVYKKSIAAHIAVLLIIGLLFSKELQKQEKAINEIVEDLDELKEKIAKIEERLDKIEENLDRQFNEIDELEESLHPIGKNLDEIEDFNQQMDRILTELGKNDTEFLEMRENLLAVKQKLDISSLEEPQYVNILSIGDAVNLVDDAVPIYSDIYSVINKQNANSSLYGQSEARYICGIIMVKDEIVTEVDNMEDYELYKSIGFDVAGYNLVNQFSLNEEGNLISEMRCGADGVKSLYKH